MIPNTLTKIRSTFLGNLKDIRLNTPHYIVLTSCLHFWGAGGKKYIKARRVQLWKLPSSEQVHIPPNEKGKMKNHGLHQVPAGSGYDILVSRMVVKYISLQPKMLFALGTKKGFLWRKIRHLKKHFLFQKGGFPVSHISLLEGLTIQTTPNMAKYSSCRKSQTTTWVCKNTGRNYLSLNWLQQSKNRWHSPYTY